jgi:type III secretion system TyeA family effector delivery regulator
MAKGSSPAKIPLRSLICLLPSVLGVAAAPARIYFLTQLREKVRTLPLKLFASPETREKLLESMQTALDREISREEVA